MGFKTRWSAMFKELIDEMLYKIKLLAAAMCVDDHCFHTAIAYKQVIASDPGSSRREA
jgi:hypothetical protein